MTTIAIRAGTIAADTCIGNGIKSGKVSKLHVIKNKYVVAGAGTWGSIMRFVRWVEQGKKKCDYVPCAEDNRIMLVEVKKDGISITHYDSLSDHRGYTIEAEFFAIGSGYELAIGALSFGADAIQAVKVAAEYDLTTQLPIEYVELYEQTLVVRELL